MSSPQAVSNPVRNTPRLPTEIWSQIFVHCAPTCRADHGRDLCDRAPFNLCLVCNSWRQIVLSTPKVWATITFDAVSFLPSQLSGVHFAGQPSPFESWLRRWIERSGSSLLTVELRMGPTLQSNPRFTAMQQAIKILLLHSNRWVSFKAFLHGHLLVEIVRKVSAGMPSLEYLHLINSEQEFRPDNGHYAMPISVCPVLDYITLDGFSLKLIPPHTVAHSLRTLHNTTGISPEEFWTYLSHLPLLMDASICISQPGMHDITPVIESHSPVEHVRLQKLKLKWENDSQFLRIGIVTFPSLTHLKIEAPGDSFALQNILPSLTRSSSRLIDLSLNCLSVSESDLINGLKLLPFIETLELSLIDSITDLTLISLTPQPWSGEPCTCPDLSSIFLENISLTPRAVKEFLCGRCHIWTFAYPDTTMDRNYTPLLLSDWWIDPSANGVRELKQFVMRNCTNYAPETRELSEDPLIIECGRVGLRGYLSFGLKTYFISPSAPTFQKPLPPPPSDADTGGRVAIPKTSSRGAVSKFQVHFLISGSLVVCFWLFIVLGFP